MGVKSPLNCILNNFKINYEIINYRGGTIPIICFFRVLVLVSFAKGDPPSKMAGSPTNQDGGQSHQARRWAGNNYSQVYYVFSVINVYPY